MELTTQQHQQQAQQPQPVVHVSPRWLAKQALEAAYLPHTLQWMPDNSSPTCSTVGCDKHMKRFFRHHCRRCGGLFCAACTEKRASLPCASHPVRVCNPCFLMANLHAPIRAVQYDITLTKVSANAGDLSRIFTAEGDGLSLRYIKEVPDLSGWEICSDRLEDCLHLGDVLVSSTTNLATVPVNGSVTLTLSAPQSDTERRRMLPGILDMLRIFAGSGPNPRHLTGPTTVIHVASTQLDAATAPAVPQDPPQMQTQQPPQTQQPQTQPQKQDEENEPAMTGPASRASPVQPAEQQQQQQHPLSDSEVFSMSSEFQMLQQSTDQSSTPAPQQQIAENPAFSPLMLAWSGLGSPTSVGEGGKDFGGEDSFFKLSLSQSQLQSRVSAMTETEASLPPSRCSTAAELKSAMAMSPDAPGSPTPHGLMPLQALSTFQLRAEGNDGGDDTGSDTGSYQSVPMVQ